MRRKRRRQTCWKYNFQKEKVDQEVCLIFPFWGCLKHPKLEKREVRWDLQYSQLWTTTLSAAIQAWRSIDISQLLKRSNDWPHWRLASKHGLKGDLWLTPLCENSSVADCCPMLCFPTPMTKPLKIAIPRSKEVTEPLGIVESRWYGHLMTFVYFIGMVSMLFKYHVNTTTLPPSETLHVKRPKSRWFLLPTSQCDGCFLYGAVFAFGWGCRFGWAPVALRTKDWFRPSNHPGLIWIFAEGNFMDFENGKGSYLLWSSYEMKVEQRPVIVNI